MSLQVFKAAENPADKAPIKTYNIVDTQAPMNEPAPIKEEVVVPAPEIKVEAKPDKDAVKEARKAYMAAEKSKREAEAILKKSKVSQGLDEALSKRKDDPTAILQALGIDPTEYLGDLITDGIKDKTVNPLKPIVDKQQKQLDEFQAQMKAMNDEKLSGQAQVWAHSVLSNEVFPVIKENVEKLEALVGMHAGDLSAASRDVFNVQMLIQKEQGRTYPWIEIAQMLDEQYDATHLQMIESVNNLTSKTQRYAKYRQTASQAEAQTAPKASATAETNAPEKDKPRLPPATQRTDDPEALTSAILNDPARYNAWVIKQARKLGKIS